jgi:hypothetical protein
VFLLEAEGIVAILLFLFWVWAIFDCISTDAALCRNLPKGVWLILVLILPDIGALAWLLLGRPERAGWRPGSTDYSKPNRARGLEDHPRFSSYTDVTERRSEELDRRLERWEAEQRRQAIEAGPAADGSGSDDVPVDAPVDARNDDLDRREEELRRRELELRERELRQRERDLDGE